MNDLTAGNVKAAMKDVGAVSADLWQVEPQKLRVLKGFNVRSRNERYQARVRKIADSILANGFYKDKALAGYVAHAAISKLLENVPVGKKATARFMPDAAFHKAAKKHAVVMHDALTKIAANPLFQHFDEETRATIGLLLSEVKK